MPAVRGASWPGAAVTSRGRVHPDDEAALAWLREVLGDEVADLAESMPRESPMTE